jgi:hypothetical protein
VAILAVATVVALAGVFLWTESGRGVTVPLPYRRMDIPVAWWAIYTGYVLGASWLLRADASIRRTLLFDGLILHFEWLLVVFLATAPLADYLSRAYQGYVNFVVWVAVAGTSYLAGRIAREAETATWRGSVRWARLPLCAGSALITGYAAWQRLWLTVGIAALGFGLGWWSSRLRLRERLEASLSGPLQARRAEWLGVAGVAGLGVLLRLAWYRHLVATVGLDFKTGFFAASDDGQSYHLLASAIAADPVGLFGSASPVARSSFDPLYPLLLGLWYRVTGVGVFPAVFIQCLLGGLTVVLVYLLGRELGGGKRLTGFLAAALAAVSQPLIFSSAVYGIEALYIPVLAAWLWAAVRYAAPTSTRGRWVWALGILGGLMLGLRRFAPLFLLGLLPWMAWAKRDIPVRRRLLDWLAATLLGLLVYSPIEAMYIASGQTRLLSRGGAVYWEAPAHFPELVPDNRRLIALGIDPFRDPLGSLARASARPAEVAQALWATIPKRISAFFFWAPFGYFNTVTLLNPTIPNAWTSTEEFYLALAVLAGMFWTLRYPVSRRVGALLLLAIGLQAFVHSVLFFTHSIRYSVPIRPYLMLFAAAAAAPLVQGLITRGFSTDGLRGHPGLQQRARS